MYARGNNAFGQQSYTAQSAYGKSMGAAYPGSSAGGPDKGSQLSMAARNSALLNGQEADIAGLRAHPSAPAHYGGQYSSVYGSAPLSSAQQVPALGSKGVGHAALESRGVYASVMPESPTFATGDYLSSSRGYGHKSDQLFSEKVSDFPSIERRQFGERPAGYVGRGLLSESSGRFTDSTFASQQQELYDRIDQSVLIRQEQLLKGQSLQSTSVDGAGRQPDYLAAKGPTIRNPTQDLMSYAGRMDADSRGLTMLSGSSYGGQHAPSILGAAPRRNVDDLMYNQSSSNPGYGVSLPPGRDYATGKGLHAASLDADYPSSLLSRGHSRIDDQKDDRVGYVRELELREEERRRDRLRDREREREREKDRERLRARERERERERERDRVRERERERERMLERRVRDRDREHKHGVDVRRERTPLRISKDRRGSSLTREGRMLRRDSPRLEALHRRHSPVKEKRRDYVCKVYSSSLVDVERDYLAIDKRYPKLFISPEFTKVVVNWPKDDLKLSLHTPVSFEHDFIEVSVAEKKHALTNLPADKLVKPEMGHTVWNAKMILMSGISRNALEELSSEKSLDDRIPHICNILRFAVIRKDHSFMAIGGRWDAVDGTDPSVDRSSLVQTVQRYAKDLTQLDLHDCCHWNSFIEIHYDRIGKDGLFSHKEVTVLFVPDLSHSLPSLDAWRAQWLAHKKSIAEREHQISLKKQKSIEKKEVSKDKGSVKDIPRTEESDIKKESTSPGKAIDVNEKEKDGSELKGLIADREGTGNEKDLMKKNADAVVEEGKPDEEKVESSGTQTSGSAKTVKKKVVRKIVKPKVSGKKPVMKNESDTQNDNLNGKDAGKNIVKSKGLYQEGSSTVKTFVRKKVVKKDPVEKAAAKEEAGAPTEIKSQVELDGSKDNPKLKSDDSNTVAVKKSPLKTITRKKIVKVKRKVSSLAANAALADGGKDGNLDEEKVAEAVNVAEISKERGGDAEDQFNESEQQAPPKTKSKTGVDKAISTSKTEVKADKENKKEEKGIDEKSGLGGKLETESHGKKASPMNSTNGDGSKSREKDLKVEKEKKDKDGKEDLKSKSVRDRDAKEKKRLEEPPRHPGLFLQMKGSKDSKLHSLSLSLDSLLDYTEKDVEESTFEISLFAESLYEMLQFQMGCRILTFLQKLRLKYVLKRNKQKRQRDEDIENETKKRLKAESSMETESVNHEKLEGSHQDVEKPEKDKSIDEADEGKLKDKVETEDDPEGGVGKEKLEDLEEEDPEEGDLEEGEPEEGDPEEDPEEDLEEDPEEDLDGDEDEEMVDAGPQRESSDKENVEGRDAKVDGEPKNVAENEKGVLPESAEMKTSKITAESEPPSDEAKVESEKKEAPPVNKEALQAFRFFDRSRVGYIRVEDMRLIIHSLGKLLSHRDVKELVQSALLESNTGRDDRILYNKLVRMRFE